MIVQLKGLRSVKNLEVRQQGETVAIYYDEDFYVGQVLEVQDEGCMASISFMSKVRNKNVFVWPEVEDIASVEAKFVVFLGCSTEFYQW